MADVHVEDSACYRSFCHHFHFPPNPGLTILVIQNQRSNHSPALYIYKCIGWACYSIRVLQYFFTGDLGLYYAIYIYRLLCSGRLQLEILKSFLENDCIL